ncbi:MAG: Uma2 family endonuclease [Chloroflexota bacterium]|nr:Uma2 family endonuclease [Dehalococcoidia bacterium]MDW8254723.1 Uma2 family endonuclease [Chloroflexota bacterium]
MSTIVRRHRFTVEEYRRLSDLGLLGEEGRTELLDGEIFDMPAIRPPHAYCVGALTKLCVLGVGDAAVVWVQNPAAIDRQSEPQPDLLLLRGPGDRYRTAHPTAADILLVIEVADTSYRHDREVKLPLYARAGIPEVWIVNLPARQVEVYREPEREAYREQRVVGPEGQIVPAALPQLAVPVAAILP